MKKLIVFSFILSLFVPELVFAASNSASYQATGESFAPAVGAAASASYNATSILVALPSGAPGSPSYSVVVGSPALAAGIAPSTSSSSSSSSGGGGGGAAPSLASSPAAGSQTGQDATGLTGSQVYNVQIGFITTTSATVTFDTYDPAITSVNYAPENNLSFVKSTRPSRQVEYSHSHAIAGLKSGTSYVFSIFVQKSDKTNTVNQSPTYRFTTVKPESTKPQLLRVYGQPTVTDFSAHRISETSVYLSWKNPDTIEFTGVKILRSETNFPNNSTEGVLVYQGTDSQFNDTLPNKQAYYYTLIPIYRSGEGVGVPAKATDWIIVSQPQEPADKEEYRELAKTDPWAEVFRWLLWIVILEVLALVIYLAVKKFRHKKG